MVKVLAIGGEPCTGKTTLVKNYIKSSRLAFKRMRVGKLLDLLYNEECKVYVLGIYEDQIGTFQGTDKLSMAVQPDAVEFFNGLTEGKVIFEGDRLFNAKMLGFLSDKFSDSFKVLVLSAPQEVLNERHETRGDDQDDKFKTSRRTKINNILCNLDLMDHITVMHNHSPQDHTKVLEFLLDF